MFWNSNRKIKEKIIELDKKYKLGYKYTDDVSYFIGELNRIFSGTIALVDDEDFSNILLKKKLGRKYHKAIISNYQDKADLLRLFKYKELINTRWVNKNNLKDKDEILHTYLLKSSFFNNISVSERISKELEFSKNIGGLRLFNDGSACRINDSGYYSRENKFLGNIIRKNGGLLFLDESDTIDSSYSSKEDCMELRIQMPTCNLLVRFPSMTLNFYARFINIYCLGWNDFFKLKDFVFQFTPFGLIFYDIYPKRKEELGVLDKFFMEYGERK